MALTDQQIIEIIKQEEQDALSYSGDGSELNNMRADVLDYYDQKPYGTEEADRSSIVTSETFQVVEGLTPEIMAPVLQGQDVATFHPTRKETKLEKMKRLHGLKVQAQMTGDKSILDGAMDDRYEREAKEKQDIVNHILTQEHDLYTILYEMTKDGLQAASGWVQVYYDECDDIEVDKLTGMSAEELEIARSQEGCTISDLEQNDNGTYDFVVTHKYTDKKYVVENIPYEECVLSRRARDFDNPPLIGQRMLKTRGEIKAMKIAPDEVVDNLKQDFTETTRVKNARHGETGEMSEDYRQNLDRSQDKLWLRRYYMHIDVDQDGIAEQWEFFYCDNQLLKKTQVYDHPYCVFVPIPKPHSAYGTSPIFHMLYYQKVVSKLFRQILVNIQVCNTPRYFVSERVNKDSWNNPVPGQGVPVKGPQIGDAAQIVPVDNQVQQIMAGIELAYDLIHKTTGYTPNTQGLHDGNMHDTASGLLKLDENATKRSHVMSKHLSVTVQKICQKLVKLVGYHQDTEMQMLVNGKEMTINPKVWSDKSRCFVDVGVGKGGRQESVMNLSYMLEQAKYFDQMGKPVIDDAKMYNILNDIAVHMGYDSAEDYFNDVSQPDNILQAENQQLKQGMAQMQAQLQQRDSIIESEKIKAQATMAKTKAELADKGKQRMADMSKHTAELENQRRLQNQKIRFEQEKLDSDVSVKLTGIQAQTDKNVNGDLIDG